MWALWTEHWVKGEIIWGKPMGQADPDYKYKAGIVTQQRSQTRWCFVVVVVL